MTDTISNTLKNYGYYRDTDADTGAYFKTENQFLELTVTATVGYPILPNAVVRSLF